MTAIAVIVVGAWMILSSQTSVSTTLTLIFGIAVVALAALELVGYRLPRRT